MKPRLTSGFRLTTPHFKQQGVAAGTRACHQRRHSRFPGDTGTDHPSVPANLNSFHPGSNNTIQHLQVSRIRRLSACILFQSRSNARKVELHTDPRSCEQLSKCVSPQGPTAGCGVIPVKGRGIRLDPRGGSLY